MGCLIMEVDFWSNAISKDGESPLNVLTNMIHHYQDRLRETEVVIPPGKELRIWKTVRG